MSKEHIWPDWMEELFPRSDSDQHNQFRARFRLDPSGETIVTQSTKTRPGHASTKHVRKVCNICNNGWMSEMEKRTKPLLLALARGEPCNIDFILQNLLATWSAKTAMTGEFSDPDSAAIPLIERKFLMTNLKPPFGWNIWITRCNGTLWETGYYHRSFTAGISHGPPVAPIKRPTPNTQTTTIGIGQLLIHMVSVSIPEIQFEGENEPRFGLKRILPIREASIAWPTDIVLSDAEVEILADTLNRTIQNNRNIFLIPVEE